MQVRLHPARAKCVRGPFFSLAGREDRACRSADERSRGARATPSNSRDRAVLPLEPAMPRPPATRDARSLARAPPAPGIPAGSAEARPRLFVFLQTFFPTFFSDSALTPLALSLPSPVFLSQGDAEWLRPPRRGLPRLPPRGAGARAGSPRRGSVLRPAAPGAAAPHARTLRRIGRGWVCGLAQREEIYLLRMQEKFLKKNIWKPN